MKITAVTRYKSGAIYNTLQKLGISVSELSRKTGINQQYLYHIINLHRRPGVEAANKIQNAFAEMGEFIDVLSEWPESFVGVKRGYKREQTIDVDPTCLIDSREVLELEAPESEPIIDGELDEILKELNDQEQRVIRQRFWDNLTQEAIGKNESVSTSRIGHIEKKALRKMKLPRIVRKLGPIIEEIGINF